MTLTLQQITKREIIMKVISELKPSGSALSQFYGLMPGQPGTLSFPGMDVGWDIFNNTRQLAKVRPPLSGPATRQRQRVGHVSARAVRLHDSLGIFDNEVYQTRPLGGNFGTIDSRGTAYVARQIKYLSELFFNAREFMVAHALQGGFGVTVSGEDMYLTTYGSGTFDVDMQIPSTHKNQLAMGTGSDIIGATWSNAATDIVGDLGALDAAFVRECGYSMRHAWINGNTFFTTVMKNTGIKDVGGSAFTIYEMFGERQIKGHDATQIDGGFDIVLRAWPHLRWHVYNQCLNPGTNADGVSTSVSTPIIPDNKVIFTPEPSPDWFGWVEGGEIVRDNVVASPREVRGFDMWSTPRIDPAGVDMKAIDIGLPAIFVPNAVAIGTVVF